MSIAIAIAAGGLAWGVHRLLCPPVWPAGGTALVSTPPSFPPGFGVHRVFLDPGHGAQNNHGATSCRCTEEEAFTLRAAEETRRRLVATGHFDVRLSREGDSRVEYAARVEDAERWGAELFVSLHADVRGKVGSWSPEAGKTCPYSPGHTGFSVIYSDEGEPRRVEGRLEAARATARELARAGLPAFDGLLYVGLYEPDAERGVFVDRHAADQRIFVLRRTAMPAILVETHNAVDPGEYERWREERTLDAFAAALARALVDVFARRAD